MHTNHLQYGGSPRGTTENADLTALRQLPASKPGRAMGASGARTFRLRVGRSTSSHGLNAGPRFRLAVALEHALSLLAATCLTAGLGLAAFDAALPMHGARTRSPSAGTPHAIPAKVFTLTSTRS